MNSTHWHSLTYRGSVLDLSPVRNASTGTNPPPLSTWSKDKSQQVRVIRVLPVTDCVQLSPTVKGEALMLVLQPIFGVGAKQSFRNSLLLFHLFY